MVTTENLFTLVGSVQDPHLPFGLAELGMLESVAFTDGGSINIVVNVPCHHCPGLRVLQDDIETTLRAAGIQQDISVSFMGSESWKPMDMSVEVRKAMRTMGIQVHAPSSNVEEGVQA